MLIIYGIPNCDSCKKARKWLENHSIEYQFHDLRADGIDRSMLAEWTKNIGWQQVLNTRSTTWRNIPESSRRNINEKRALDLMLEKPTLIKRPVLATKNTVLVGFSPETYDAILA